MRAVAVVVGIGLLGISTTGCIPQPDMTLTPETAVAVCEAPTVLALRAKDDRFQSLTLDPAATTRIEPRQTYVGSQRLGMVVAGHGTAMLGTGKSELDYLCLIAPGGDAVFVDVATLSGTTILAECADSKAGGSPRRACLEDLLQQAESGLATAEAGAIRRARQGRSRAARAEVEQPVVTSIGAWRVYRDAECARQRDADPQLSIELYEACRVGMTRQRVRELGG